MKNILLFLLLFSCVSTSKSKNKTSEIPKYKRSEWKHWIDKDNDCQNERAEILISSSIAPVGYRTERGCVVDSGKWYGPYTGIYYHQASQLDIDHIVPLKHAHDHGGALWSRKKKKEFANDWANLLAVERRQNRKKSADGPDEYMPPNEDFHCQYLTKWKHVKEKYGLTMSYSEKQFLEHKESDCMIDYYEKYHIPIDPTY